MPSKKKKYNARFPAGRIKKIMQTDEEVGKVAQAVPVIISRTLELFVESLLTKTLKITNARNAKTLSPSHMKQCITSESRFDFLRDLVKNIPDIGTNEELSGSEAGYGNEGTSPASTSTSSSNGGGLGGTLPYEVPAQVAGSFQRSESYSPGTTTGSTFAQHTNTTMKRGFPGQGGSLNFYKEIPLEESTDSPPPPKLSRLNSAPASSTVPAIPFKIDILPSIASPTVSAVDPVIKLDYSNLKLPTVATGSVTAATTNPTKAAAQPTVKIDLSRLVTVTAPAKHVPSTIVTRTTERQQHHPTNLSAVCVSPGSAVGSSTTSSFSTSAQSTPTTPVLPSPSPTTAPPIFSALSSTIPGMDEDYDDI
ncbi:dr1-associated corepressor [Anopheles bellator]|uniref:dr1-associated corepressor n=1 Tax=Anopheles bellator TaxID=139047 RepID=UPI002647C3E9|nr:dr1-associated corepressor [Anopheles bellator]